MEVLPKLNIKPIVITARRREIVKNRCRELGISEIHQGVRDKRDVLEKMISESPHKFLEKFCTGEIEVGRYDLGHETSATVMSYITKPAEFTEFKTHGRFIIIHYIVFGTELVLTGDKGNIDDSVSLTIASKEDAINDNYDATHTFIFYHGDLNVLSLGQAYRDEIVVQNPQLIRKIVF